MSEPEPIYHLDRSASAARLVEAVDALPFALAVLDADGTVTSANRHWHDSASLGDHLVGHDLGICLPAHLEDAPKDQAAVAEHVRDGLTRVLSGRAPSFELQYELPQDDGGRWFLISLAAMGEGGAVVTHQETTVHHNVQDLLAELAYHDPLTGLPNRMLVLDRLRMALVRAARSGGRPAVVFLDLNGFKEVNDRYGHEVGDHVLVELGQRLSRSVRDGDTCGRWGGDEFVIVVELAHSSGLEGLIARTESVFNAPFAVDDRLLELGASIGAVLSRLDERAEALMRRADEAMYKAKFAEGDVSDISAGRRRR